MDEARKLTSHFEIHGALDSAQTKRALGDKSKEYLLSLVQRKGKRRY